jgi:hypothetical protein
MASTIQLKRSAQSGKVPDTGSLNLGELAINTYDGKIYFKKSGSVESVESVLTTNSVVTGSIRLEGTGSFGSLKVNDTLTINHGEAIISGSALVTSDLTILGAVNARQFNISVISSSVLFESGSSRFGNTSDDTHDFTGSVNLTGSLYVNGVAVGGSSNSGSFTGSFTGSFSGDGSGLRGVVSDDIPRDGWDYDSNSSASINDFNDVSDKYFIDFEQSQSTAVGTPVGFKGFLTNVSGSTQILPTLDSINFIVRDNLVASIGVGGIIAQPTAGTVSGSSQLTSSYDSRYVLSGSITQTTWDNIASKPGGIVSGSSQVVGILSSLNTYTGSNDTTNTAQNTRLTTIESVTGSYETKGSGIVSGSSQLTSSVLATTGSNSFIGNQNISGTIFLTGSIIPSSSFVYDLGSETNSFRDLFLSTGSIRFHNPDGTEQGRITVDASSGDISLLKTAGLTNEQKATISQGNINPNFLSAVSASNLFVQNKIVLPIGGTVHGINLTAFSSSVSSTILNQNAATSSYETKGRGIVSGSSQVDVMSTTNIARLATTGSNTFFGTQTFSGSVYIANDLIVQGSSSIQYISASSVSIGTNIIQLNTANPSVRFAGLTIIDSGSVGGSGSFLYDSVQDEFIFVHRGNGTNVTSSHFILGPETYDNLGNEAYLTNNRIPKGTGIEHLNDSNISDTGTLITLGSNTVVNGTLLATGTTLVSGSSQITYSSISSIPGGIVSGSAQTIANLPTGVVSGSTQTIANLPTGTVSGSSQITLSSTTGYGSVLNQAVLTSSSPTFAAVTVSSATLSSSAPVLILNGSAGSAVDTINFNSSGTNYASIISNGGTGEQRYSIGPSAGWGGYHTFYTDTTEKVRITPAGNTGFGLTNPQSQVHLNGTITFTEAGYDTVRKHTITHGHSDGSSPNNYVAINVSDGSGTTAERIRVNGSGQLLPAANGTQDLGSTSLRWGTIYTSDLSLNNGIGDWTIVEGEDDLFLYNNKKGKVYKFALTEVDPNVATPKKS